jgi:hypothetical protein
MIRNWVKILPFFIIEHICMKVGYKDYQKIGTKTYIMHQITNGLFLLKDIDLTLREKRSKLLKELDKIDKELGDNLE